MVDKEPDIELEEILALVGGIAIGASLWFIWPPLSGIWGGAFVLLAAWYLAKSKVKPPKKGAQ